MNTRLHRQAAMRRRNATGFSMIEVLIALLVLAFGLLGLALLQTMNLRYTQSANQRTQATNLAYELLDLVRANRVLVNDYTQITQASFGGVVGAACPVDNLGTTTPTESMFRWRCQVRATLGEDAWATMTVPTPGFIRVEINWADQRWDAVPANRDTSFFVETRL